MRRPFGDQAGALSRPGAAVSWRGVLPFTGMTCSRSSSTKAIRSPPGDQAGSQPATRRRSADASARRIDLAGALDDQALAVGRPVGSQLVARAGPRQAAAMGAVGVYDEEIRRSASRRGYVREAAPVR